MYCTIRLLHLVQAENSLLGYRGERKMGLIAIDRVWSLGFCFGVQGFHSNDFLAFSFHGGSGGITIATFLGE